jgi:hypothetical protein
MLMSDRSAALRQKNASAAITASAKIADLLHSRVAEEEAAKPPITQLVHVIMHQVICPLCKERSPVSATSPLREEPAAAPPHRVSAWDDVEPEPEPVPATPPPPDPVRQPRTIEVPKVARKRTVRRLA